MSNFKSWAPENACLSFRGKLVDCAPWYLETTCGQATCLRVLSCSSAAVLPLMRDAETCPIAKRPPITAQSNGM
ncbi:hypothetical protein AK812_SmicGene38360 [Symbiodinium microadriaticum]|uniref:Uncharacterized protein n=1 Tax=Symbiodinium microadriaticum TaxID=2951 RepID=A0A1Q9CDY5_SYMMI|nr:hypothetical protein AK812_SmicGene38360 [Symbiodinium microadriaticum]